MRLTREGSDTEKVRPSEPAISEEDSRVSEGGKGALELYGKEYLPGSQVASLKVRSDLNLEVGCYRGVQGSAIDAVE